MNELSDFVAVCTLVRPEGLEGLKTRSVRKKMEQKPFATSVSREGIFQAPMSLVWTSTST